MSMSRRGFTLTELLIVIAIIAVLAGLITAAAVRALHASKRARVVLEIKNISGSMENFKNDYNAYPPNTMNLGTGDQTLIDASNEMVRMFKKAFPRMNQQEMSVVRALAGENMSSTNVTSSQLLYGMTADEALVFWLGGFSDDAQFPISGQGGPSFVDTDAPGDEIMEDRKQRYEFDRSRLGPRNEDTGAFNEAEAQRFVSYTIDLNGDNDASDPGEKRQLNLWRYYPSGSTQPLVYFDASRSKKPVQYDPPAAVKGVRPELNAVYAFKKVREGLTTATVPNDIAFVNTGKFQVLHCGLDDAWGDLGPTVTNATSVNDVTGPIFPGGPFIGDVADTLTNFFDGEISDAESK